MHEALEDASVELRLDLSNLRRAAETSAGRLEDAMAAAAAFLRERGYEPDEERAPVVTAFGSMARQEMSPGSDFDYLVILTGPESDPQRIQAFRQSATRALEAIQAPPPGASGLFGVAVSAVDFVNTIGLEQDSNLHISRRILLLQESVPLNNRAAWEGVMLGVAARYLHEDRREEANRLGSC